VSFHDHSEYAPGRRRRRAHRTGHLSTPCNQVDVDITVRLYHLPAINVIKASVPRSHRPGHFSGDRGHPRLPHTSKLLAAADSGLPELQATIMFAGPQVIDVVHSSIRTFLAGEHVRVRGGPRFRKTGRAGRRRGGSSSRTVPSSHAALAKVRPTSVAVLTGFRAHRLFDEVGSRVDGNAERPSSPSKNAEREATFERLQRAVVRADHQAEFEKRGRSAYWGEYPLGDLVRLNGEPSLAVSVVAGWSAVKRCQAGWVPGVIRPNDRLCPLGTSTGRYVAGVWSHPRPGPHTSVLARSEETQAAHRNGHHQVAVLLGGQRIDNRLQQPKLSAPGVSPIACAAWAKLGERPGTRRLRR